MKRPAIFLTCQLSFFYFSSAAQPAEARLNGVIKDAVAKPMAGATVSLKRPPDSLFKQTVADTNGHFSFTGLIKGHYRLAAGFTGYSTYHSTDIYIADTGTQISLPVIILRAEQQTVLQAITITGQKALIEQKPDRVMVNTGAMITAAGSNVLELLTKSPGVMIDLNGNISLNGKNNVLVLIDDRPTYLSAQNLSDYLKSLPAGLLDKIELISNPPAKYDANGAAIINLVLKKNRNKGFNGAVSESYNQGVYARNNASLNINYHAGKLNVFGNFSYSHNNDVTENEDRRYFYNTDGSLNAALLVNSRYQAVVSTWNARMGADYFVSPKTTLGIMVTGNSRPKRDRTSYTSNQFTGNLQPDSGATGNTNGYYHWQNSSINLNLQHNFDSARKKLTADIDLVGYRSDGTQQSLNTIYLPDGSQAGNEGLLFVLPYSTHIWSVKADYTQVLTGHARFDAGFKSSAVSNNNRSDWYNQSGNSFVADEGKSDHFVYKEHINAAYLTVVKEWRRWSMQAGLRLEHTHSFGHQPGNTVITDSSFTIDYISAFPSLYASYKLDSAGRHSLTFSYSQRIHRPSYQQLNPFLFYHDRYSYSAGNPGLLPGYGNFPELRYNYKQFMALTLSYGRQTQPIYNATETSADRLVTRTKNFSGGHFIGLISNCTFSPARWWQVNASAVVLFFSNNKGPDSLRLPASTNLHEIEIFNQFHFNHGWNAELTGFFPGKQSFGQYRSEAVYNISAGIQKSIFQKKGSLRLKMDDIFHTMNPRGVTTGIKQVTAFRSGRSDTRQIGFSFSYRFGKDANARKRNHTSGGAAEEEKRAN